jgi:hypothetical protein
LDLPTQQELLAQFRCDEIAAVAMEKFNTQAKSLRRAVEGGKVVEGLGASMKGWRGEAVGSSHPLLLLFNHMFIYLPCVLQPNSTKQHRAITNKSTNANVKT